MSLPRSRVVFTVRGGGVSEGPFASRNLGLHTDDDSSLVQRNIDQTCDELGISAPQLLRQVHGGSLVTHDPERHHEHRIGDGIVVEHEHAPVLITGADCPTVVLASDSRLVALHCGWRPVADGLIEAAAREFEGEVFAAAIGPGICADHFEVGPEVVEAMGEDGERFSSGRQLDLNAVIDARLTRGGAERVHAVERCTFCEPEHFFSHRRDAGVTGRQAGIAWRV